MKRIFYCITAVDNAYTPHLGTLLSSIGENAFEKGFDYSIYFTIIDFGISENNKEKLMLVSQKNNSIKLFFKTANAEMVRNRLNLPDRSDVNRKIINFSALLLDHFIPKNAEYLLWLDVDTIILNPIHILFDKKPKLFAGVLDIVSSSIRNKTIGNDHSPYFNSGVLLWNMKEFRKLNLENQFKKTIKNYKGQWSFTDQFVINATVSDYGTVIEPEWNLMSPEYYFSYTQLSRYYDLKNFYSKEQLVQAKNKPALIHFTNEILNSFTRVWHENSIHPYYHQYWYYRHMTEFMGTPCPDPRSSFRKSTDIFFRLLPVIVTKYTYNLIHYFKKIESNVSLEEPK